MSESYNIYKKIIDPLEFYKLILKLIVGGFSTYAWGSCRACVWDMNFVWQLLGGTKMQWIFTRQ